MPTKIEWSQESWNPVTGCSKISTGCRNCYAERMAKRLAGRYGYPEQPNHFDVTLHKDKLDQPFHWKKPRAIFVSSMGDLFHEDVPDDYIFDVLDVIAQNGPCYLGQTEDDPEGTFWQGHTFQVLTKRPERMKAIMDEWTYRIDNGMTGLLSEMYEWYTMEYGHYLPHLWLGVTAENQEMAAERIPWLLKTPAAVRFVSIEPMLGYVDLSPWTLLCGPSTAGPFYNYEGKRICGGGIGGQMMTSIPSHYIDWVICGGETGPGAREMKAAWAFDLYQQCRDAGVPFFFKKEGDAFQGDPAELPTAREFPNT